MSVGRRDFIIGSLGVAATAQLIPGCGDDSGDAGGADSTVFAHGVGSGDPLQTAVLLWTRVSGQTAPVAVNWTVATDPELKTVVQAGMIMASDATDYTVQFDVQNLLPGTYYYYRFEVGHSRSVIGRTHTLPTTLDHARIALTSCANWQNGYFAAYRAIANRADLDVWIHVGDYIYEYGVGEYADASLAAQRSHSPANEAITLADYRGRYAQYRTDPDLQELHRQHPLIVVWDDHEFANNAWKGGAQNHDPRTEGLWDTRKASAQQAFREWLPIRAIEALPTPKIFRSFQFGDLFDLIMLDTRMYARDEQAGGSGDYLVMSSDTAFGQHTGTPADWDNPDRHIIGPEQETWFLKQLSDSQTRLAHWRFVGNQVVFTQGKAPPEIDATMGILFSDFWDGYRFDRDQVIDYALKNGIQNMVFLTGDIHSSIAMEISKDPFDPKVYDPAAGLNAFAVEIVGPSVTSQSLEGTPELAALAPTLLKRVNPHVPYCEFTKKGYVLVDVTADRFQAEWWYVTNYKTPNDASQVLGQAYTCQSGAARLVATTTPTPDKPGAAAPAPAV